MKYEFLRSRGKSFSLFAFIFFSVWLYSGNTVLAVDPPAPVPETMTIPHTLPYDDGTKVWTGFFATRNNSGGTHWNLHYHNFSNLVYKPNLVGSTDDSDIELKNFYSTDNGATWTEDTVTEASEGDGGFYIISTLTTMGSGYTVAKNNWFASYTILVVESAPDYPSDTRWKDLYPSEVRDTAVQRVNFAADGTLIGVATFIRPEEIEDLIFDFEDCDGYTDIGCYITETVSGTVGYLISLFVPSSDFFSSRWDVLKATADEKFPIVGQIKTAIEAGATGSTSIAITGLSFGGSSVASATLFNPAQIEATYPTGIAFLKFLIATMLWASLAYTIINKSITIFKN